VTGKLPKSLNKHDMDRFLHLVKFDIWDDPYLFKYYLDQIVRRCVPNHEITSGLFAMIRPMEGTLV